jgi:hypothetical protein
MTHEQMTIIHTMTDDQRKRLPAALSETQRTLDREMKYMPHLRDTKLIAFCTNHIATLKEMIAA